jgi:hypothetical protein
MSDVTLWHDDAEAKQVYHLRLGGLSFEEIADRNNMTVDMAMTLYRDRVMAAAKIFGTDDRQMIKQLELDRLDALQQSYWHDATEGDLKSAEFVLKIIGTRIKLEGMEQLSAATPSDVARVLIVGGSQQEFVAALQQGRAQHAMTSPAPEDGVDLKEG